MPRNRTTPAGYVLPGKPRWGGGLNAGAFCAAVAVVAAVCSGATEWVAQTLHNPIELGRLRIPVKSISVPEGKRSVFLRDSDQGSERSDAGEMIV